MNARRFGLCLLLLALPAAAQAPPPGGAPEAPRMPPPRPPEIARSAEGARVVERDVAAAAALGNESLMAGRYGEARASYEEAQVLAPELPELEYNRGVTLLLEGQFEDAERALEQGISLSRTVSDAENGQEAIADPALAGDGEFNLGHVAFGKQDLAGAARRFAMALASEPDSADARRNLELVLRAIQDQEQQEEQQQDDQQQDQQDQEEQQDEQEQQEQQDQENEEDQQEQQQDQEQQEDQQEQQQDQQQQQQDQEEQQEQEQQPKPGEMSREQIEQLLDSLAEEEREALKREQEARRKEALPAPGGKDW